MKIICNNGEGRERNPFEKIGGWPQVIGAAYTDFEKSHPPLPVYDQSGKLFTGSGEFEAELVWQYKNGFQWVFDKNHDSDTSINYKYETRQIYRISDHIPEDFQKEKETKPSEKINSSAITRRFERTFLPHGGNPPDIEKLEPGEEESVERLPIVQAGIDYCKLMGIESIGRPICAFIAGAAYQKSQPNLIEKEKVIELLEAMAKDFKQYGDHIELRTVQECISKIKSITN